MWSWLRKASSGVAGALGGPLVYLLAYVVERVGTDAIKAMNDWLDERHAAAVIREKKKAILADYQTAMKYATTPEDREAANAKYQAALAALNISG